MLWFWQPLSVDSHCGAEGTGIVWWLPSVAHARRWWGGGVGEANYVLALSALAPVQHKDEGMKWKWVWARERALAWQWKWAGQGEVLAREVEAGRKSAAWGWKSEDKHEVKDVSFKRCPRGEARQRKARRGASGMWRGQAQAMAKGKPGRLCWAIVIVVLEVGDPKTVPHSNAGQSKLW